jgi:3-methylcrotonyl-CoA carboxylase beta subunit
VETPDASSKLARAAHLRHLVEQLHKLEDRLREGGGDARIEKQHRAGKMTARERIDALLDVPADFLEIGLLIAYDRYDGQAPAAGVVTGLGKIEGRTAVIVANDATVKAGAWWPETITKILRAQEIAMRNRLPIIYLVDSAGVNLPYQDGIFPGQYGAGRIFYYNSLMRRKLRIPQIAAVMGPCIAGGAYLPALSDVIIMVAGASFMGLGGPNLVKGATGQTIDSEPLGGARLHTVTSGVAHYMAANDAEALSRIRQRLRLTPVEPVLEGTGSVGTFGVGILGVSTLGVRTPSAPRLDPSDLYAVLPADHRLPYEIEQVIFRIFDAGDYVEFQPEHAPEMLCANACLSGHPVAIVANRRGFLKSNGRPRIGGIVYTESARKVAYFVETAERSRTPLIYLQDVSGFMVGPEAEREGIIRAGAEMVETMSCASVPKIVLTLNHASGAGYYAMAGQGFDPNFTFNWPTARIGVMEGDSAVVALFAAELEKYKGQPLPEELQKSIEKTKADYERWLDAKYAAARGHADAVIDPLDSRKILTIALEACMQSGGAQPTATGVTL